MYSTWPKLVYGTAPMLTPSDDRLVLISDHVKVRGLCANVAGLGRIRRNGRHRLGVASIDAATGKAPLAIECVVPNPTNRWKNGRKRSLLIDACGVSLSLIASGASVHDVTLLEPTLDRTVPTQPNHCVISVSSPKITAECLLICSRRIRG